MNKKRMKIGIMSFALIILILTTQSCSKEETGSILKDDLAVAFDDAYANALYDDIDNMVQEEISDLDNNLYNPQLLKSTETEECFKINVDFADSVHFPKIITIDYGDGCTVIYNNDTITRKGIIKITTTGRWNNPGSQHIITFIGFSINDVSIDGTRTITNNGFNGYGHLIINSKLENGVISFNETEIITMNSEYQREIIHNNAPISDSVLITGGATGINVRGENYSRTIIKPLILVHCKEYKFRWVIVDGQVEIVNNVRGTTVIDYSADECNGKLLINKNGYRHNYIFKYKYHHKKL